MQALCRHQSCPICTGPLSRLSSNACVGRARRKKRVPKQIAEPRLGDVPPYTNRVYNGGGGGYRGTMFPIKEG